MASSLFRKLEHFKPNRIRRFFTSGDRIVPAGGYITWNAKDPVKIRFSPDKSPENYPPVLVSTMFRTTVENHPEQVAIVAGRSGTDWRLKWTFERFGAERLSRESQPSKFCVTQD